MKDLVSIVTVTYNSEKYLERTIQSVIDQTYNNVEYIIIDGASSDQTIDIIKKYEKNIDYWFSEPDEGIYDAMNKGIKVAKGKIIGIINSDDWYQFDTIEEVVRESEVIEDNKFVIHGNIARYDAYGSFLDTHVPKKFPFSFLFSTPFKHPATFISKDIYSDIGLYKTNCGLAADYDLMLRILKSKYLTKHIDKVFSNVRMVGKTTSGDFKIPAKEIYSIIKQNTGSIFLSTLGILGRKFNNYI